MISSATSSTATSPTRIVDRQNRTRERILVESTRLFLSQGFGSVSVDAIVDAAGVARSTFYRFFANRDDVILSIIRPIFESGLDMMQGLDKLPPRKAMEGIFRVYLDLWTSDPDALQLTIRMGGTYFRLFDEDHHQFRQQLIELLELIEPSGLLLNDSSAQTARLIARIAVSVLDVYRDESDLETLYLQTMNGLLIKPEALQ